MGLFELNFMLVEKQNRNYNVQTIKLLDFICFKYYLSKMGMKIIFCIVLVKGVFKTYVHVWY